MKRNGQRRALPRFSLRIFAPFFLFFGALQENAKNSLIVKKIRELLSKIDFENRIVRKTRLAAAKEIEQSIILHALNRIFERLLYTPLRVYGTFCMSCAVCSALFAHARDYLRNGIPSFVPSDVWSVFFFLVALLLLIFPRGRTVASAVNESSILSGLFFSLLGVDREKFESEETRSGGHFAAFLIAAGLVILTRWVSPAVLLSVIVCILFVRIALLYPESALLLCLLAMPFVSGTTFSAALILSFCAYLLKALRGKRNPKGTLFGFVFLMFALLFLCSVWIVPAGSGSVNRLLPVMLLGYFAASMMLDGKKTVLRGAAALSISAFAASVWWCVFYGLSFLPDTVKEALSFLPDTCVPPGFAHGETFGLFIAVCTPFFLVRFVMNGKIAGRLLFVFAALPMTAAVFLSRSVNVWFVFLAVLLVMLILHRGVHLITALLLIVAGTAAYFVFSSASQFLAGFADGFSASGNAVRDQFIASATHFFAPLGAGSAIDGGNFYGRLLVSCGIVGVLLLLTVVLGAWGYACTVSLRAKHSDVHLHILLNAFSAAIAACLMAGIACDLWTDDKMIFLFFFLIGGLFSAGRAYAGVSERTMLLTDLDRDFVYTPSSQKAGKAVKPAKRAERGEKNG